MNGCLPEPDWSMQQVKDYWPLTVIMTSWSSVTEITVIKHESFQTHTGGPVLCQQTNHQDNYGFNFSFSTKEVRYFWLLYFFDSYNYLQINISHWTLFNLRPLTNKNNQCMIGLISYFRCLSCSVSPRS